jgi:phage baseplate assembly protein W
MAAYKSGAVNPNRKSIIHKDLGLTFSSHPVTKRLTVLKNENAIKRAIRNLILTNKGERFFNPLFGGNITSQLFENFGPITAINMREDITEAVQTYEPRATVLEVEVKQNIDLNSVMINIFFTIDENPQVQELSFNVERIR